MVKKKPYCHRDPSLSPEVCERHLHKGVCVFPHPMGLVRPTYASIFATDREYLLLHFAIFEVTHAVQLNSVINTLGYHCAPYLSFVLALITVIYRSEIYIVGSQK